jgi:hypothetical protein
MQINVGDGDRIARLIAGIVLLSLVLIVDSQWRWLGLFGFIPVLTAIGRWCPLYTVLGINTSKKETRNV